MGGRGFKKRTFRRDEERGRRRGEEAEGRSEPFQRCKRRHSGELEGEKRVKRIRGETIRQRGRGAQKINGSDSV